MTLTKQPTLTAETTDQTFAPQKAANQAASGFGNGKLQGVFKRDNVSGVDDVFTIYFNFVNGTVAA
jgi:hypothetical protein